MKAKLMGICCMGMLATVWFALHGVQTEAATAAQDRTVLVMSYNIHFGVGLDGRYDLQRIADVIRTSGADIVGLQEVDVHFGRRSHFEDQATTLARDLGMQRFFAPIYDFGPTTPHGQRRQSGVAILTRFPIRTAVNHPMTRLPTLKPFPLPDLAPNLPIMMPGFAELVVDVHGRYLHVFNTHLDYRSDKRVRVMQVCDMMHITAGQSPAILVGDLNASPWEPELAPVFHTLNDAAASCTGQCFTYPADHPKALVDYVLASPGISIDGFQVISTTASDHRPVVARLTL